MMRTKEEIKEELDKRIHGSGGYSVGITAVEVARIQVELLLDIRELLKDK